MTSETYLDLKNELIADGYAEEIDWSESVKPPTKAIGFFCEYAWVVINSGMKNQVAEKIWDAVQNALADGLSASTAFGHEGKCKAIDHVFKNREVLFNEYLAAEDKLEFFEALPWIGKITKYHLAKNFGIDVCKPDRHLVRIAEAHGMEPTEMCEKLAEITGDRVATVDMVIWRAANLGRI